MMAQAPAMKPTRVDAPGKVTRSYCTRSEPLERRSQLRECVAAHRSVAKEEESRADNVTNERLGCLRRRRIPVVVAAEDEVGAEVDCVAVGK